jgi:hypothetical protein
MAVVEELRTQKDFIQSLMQGAVRLFDNTRQEQWIHHGAKDLCDVSLRMQLQVQSMSKKTKKRKQDEDIEDDDRHRKK